MDYFKNKEFGQIISKIINGNNLSRQESYISFSQVLNNEISEMQQGAFLAALTAKGETAEEIAGGWQAVYELDTNKVILPDDTSVLDNCGTGMDSFKTFNISTASSVVGAAGGLNIARHGARAITSKCGTVDIAEHLGVDVECSVDLIADSICKTGLGLFNGMSPEVHPTALGRILSQICFGSPLNIAASLANPALPKRAVRGVYNRELLLPVINVMKEIGYQNAIVVHGSIDSNGTGIDEASVCGKTFGYQLAKGEIKAFDFTPDSVGLTVHNPEGIVAKDTTEESAYHLVRVLSGKENGACRDIVLLNSALLFLSGEVVETIKDGVELAREIVKEGKALEKLEQWVAAQNRDSKKGLSSLKKITDKI